MYGESLCIEEIGHQVVLISLCTKPGSERLKGSNRYVEPFMNIEYYECLGTSPVA
jgi:hypothetical protein